MILNRRLKNRLFFYLFSLYNAHGHQLRSTTFEKAQLVTALGIIVRI